VLIGPSRIYLGDHWASDVLGAYLIGGVLLGLAVNTFDLRTKGGSGRVRCWPWCCL
jgi:membrane-associated phospholipid phosphatase